MKKVLFLAFLALGAHLQAKQSVVKMRTKQEKQKYGRVSAETYKHRVIKGNVGISNWKRDNVPGFNPPTFEVYESDEIDADFRSRDEEIKSLHRRIDKRKEERRKLENNTYARSYIDTKLQGLSNEITHWNSTFTQSVEEIGPLLMLELEPKIREKLSNDKEFADGILGSAADNKKLVTKIKTEVAYSLLKDESFIEALAMKIKEAM